MGEPFLIEVSSEAGRKIGGIYTVLQSKARFLRPHFGSRRLFIGFWDERCSSEVRLLPPPPELESVFAELGGLGIFCHWGVWTAGDEQPIILVDAKTYANRPAEWEDGGPHRDIEVNRIKFMLWKSYGVDSLMEGSWDFSENAAWGWAVGLLLERLAGRAPYSSGPLIVQFHEWISGAALLYCHMRSLPLATVFTTHATVLGRSLAAAGTDVLAAASKSRLPIETSAAYRLKVEGKHQLEMAAAKHADVFTTVSDSVAAEVRYILGREPDVITLNGLDLHRLEDEGRVRHLSAYMRQEMLQLAESGLAPHYQARYDHALLTFISGRYEFLNKGFDIYIRSLGLLNQKLKKKGARDGRLVIAFIFTPSSVRGPRLAAVRNYLLLDKIHEVLEAAGVDGERYRGLAQRMASAPSSLQADLQQMASSFIREGERPPVCLFDLNYANDEVLRALDSASLRNAREDVVKVFFYPTYVRPDDGLMAMNYYDVISGFDVGVFPSRYEPFGYTPLEAALKFDIPVSSDSAGFGRYLQARAPASCGGVKVLSMGAGGEHAASELAEYLEHLYYLDEKQLNNCKEEAYKLMSLFDWKELISNYMAAYGLAAQKKFGKAVSLSVRRETGKSPATIRTKTAHAKRSLAHKKRK
ncbi:MAG: glycogen/starch synthase [Candidatus Marsarchaeota archaeon]|nr:glycogen/starch synthase [Candidatus Marsarchaeota archaeon]